MVTRVHFYDVPFVLPIKREGKPTTDSIMFLSQDRRCGPQQKPPLPIPADADQSAERQASYVWVSYI